MLLETADDKDRTGLPFIGVVVDIDADFPSFDEKKLICIVKMDADIDIAVLETTLLNQSLFRQADVPFLCDALKKQKIRIKKQLGMTIAVWPIIS